MRFLLSIVFLLTLHSAWALPSSYSLDTFIEQTAKDKIHSPFLRGEPNVKNHPLYKDIIAFARTLNTKIIWSDSVSEAVLKFPHNEARMKVSLEDEFEGWFDEFTSPNTIVLHRDTFFSTLIHEMRHTVQLGSHNKITGNWFDKVLQTNKKKVAAFIEKVKKLRLKESEKKKLQTEATKLIETCSEINAHSDEVSLARSHRSLEQVQNNKEFVAEYKAEYKKAYQFLKKHELSSNESFIPEVDKALTKFLSGPR
jgi:hypothetical protein